jgi:glyoxylase-like metal-dependent hydrolase (beta-lactamase superfamily II)
MAELKHREVAPGIFVVHIPLPMKPTIVNVTLLHSDGEWALVDTGMNTPEGRQALEAALREVGCATTRLRAVICTHHHADHFGMSRVVKELTGARVYLHARDYASAQSYAPRQRSDASIAFYLRHGMPLHRYTNMQSPGDFWGALYAPAEVDHFMDDGDRVQIGRLTLEVITTPGHTAGHCVLYLRAQRIMIVGDHLLPRITPHVGLYPGGPANPLGDFLASQRKIQPWDVDLVLPAHGGVYRDHRHRSQQIIQHHYYRLRELLDIVRRGPRSAYDLAAEAFGFDVESPLMVQFPATFETLAHLEYLRAEGRVVCEEQEERVLYRAV